jgi:hypothetical protein
MRIGANLGLAEIIISYREQLLLRDSAQVNRVKYPNGAFTSVWEKIWLG